MLLLSTSLLAEEPSGIVEGTVTDESGAVIADARVSLRSASNLTREIVTDENGRYLLDKIQFGEYTLTADKNGFLAERQTVKIASGSQTYNLTLKLAPVSESVTVIDNRTEGAVENTLKLPGTLKETPRSVSVINAERIREQNFRQAPDIFAYTPGFTANSFRSGGYHFYARGNRMLPDDTRVDGFAGINVGGGFGANLFGVEQAVLLRGPAGLLYGSTGSPGGLINLVTKKPQEARSTRIDLRGGGFAGNGVSLGERGSFGLDFDSTGSITSNGRILYRTLLSIENMNYFTGDVLDRNRQANASLTFKLDEEGRYILTPLVQIARFNRPAGGGILISPSTSLLTNDTLTEINTDDLSPLDVNTSAGGRIDQTGQTGLEFRGSPTNALQINAAYRFFVFNTDINQFTPQVSTPAQRTLLTTQNLVQRVQSKSETDRKYHNVDVNAIYELRSAGWWKNMTQVGFYSRVADSRTTAGFTASPQSPINIYTGTATAPLVDRAPTLSLGAWTRDIFWNGYVQNRTSLDNGRWIVTIGLGYGQNDPAVGTVRKSDLLPNAALVFNAAKNLALYGSYSTSYNPVDPEAEDFAGSRNAFSPTVGKNYEIGAKYDLPLRRTFFTFSVFQNQLDNALVQSGINDFNPNGNRYFAAVGARRSRGAELTAETSPLNNWIISGAVSYIDAIYKGGGPASVAATTAIPGSRVEKTPRWSYSLWNRYDRTEGFLKGFGAGLGVVWQDERLGSNGARTLSAPDPLVLPSFTKVDAALFYRVNKNLDFAVNIENLFDKLIFVNGSVGSSLEIASPRTITFRTSYRF